jgi:hypothetical protein
MTYTSTEKISVRRGENFLKKDQKIARNRNFLGLSSNFCPSSRIGTVKELVHVDLL